MIKLTIQGTPEDVAAFNALLQSAKVEIVYASDGRKWSATDKWCSQKMGVNLPVSETPAPALNIAVNERKRRGAGKGQTKDKSGYVYLMPGPEGSYKIGKSGNPKSRRETFGVKLPFDVEFVHLIQTSDMGALEKQLHRQFAAKRRGRSEFFMLSPEDVELIKSMKGGK